jgi:hypothetical protein
MSVYKLFPSKDATIYSKTPYKNTGLDEILELTVDTTSSNASYNSRFLIQFDTTEIQNIYNDFDLTVYPYDINLRCYNAEANGLDNSVILEIKTVYAGSPDEWNMGTGKDAYDPYYINGVSWIYKQKDYTDLWPTNSNVTYTTSWYNVAGGGAWFSASIYQYTQSFSYYTNKDINVSVKQTVNDWKTGSISNNGFLVKIKDDVDYPAQYSGQGTTSPSLKYFSRDTHTIYPPCLEFKWDDSEDNSNNISILNTLPAVISVDNNPGVFYPTSINQFRVNSRPEYPSRVFQTSSYYTQNYGLPYGDSWYAIKDLDTNEYVIDFDDQYTQLSLDDSGSYFTLYMNGLEPERYYSVLIKTIINNNTLVFDTDYNFKVING